MERPDVYYALALGLFVAIEAGFRAFRREAFGPLTWVIAGQYALASAVYWSNQGLAPEVLTGILSRVQLGLHMAALFVGFLLARGLVGHLAASLFFPMAMVGGLMVWGKISAVTWWWGLFYLACAQLVLLGMGSNLHPMGRKLRRWGSQIHQHFNRLVGVA